MMNQSVSNLLVQLIGMQSFSGEVEKLADWLYETLISEGFEVNICRIENNAAYVLAKIGTPGVILATHLDTVRPFQPPAETDTSILGRGACDAKASMAAMLAAAIACKNDGLRDFGIAFTAREEVDFWGVKRLITLEPDCPFVVVGDPTSLAPSLRTLVY